MTANILAGPNTAVERSWEIDYCWDYRALEMLPQQIDGQDAWLIERNQYLASLGNPVLTLVTDLEQIPPQCIPKPNFGKPRGYKRIVDFNLDNLHGLVDPIGMELEPKEPAIPTFAELQRLFDEGMKSGNYFGFVKALNYVDMRHPNIYIMSDIVLDMPVVKPDQIIEPGSKSEFEIFSIWRREFEKEKFLNDENMSLGEPEVQPEQKQLKPAYIRENLPFPDFVTQSREAYLAAIGSYTGNFKRWKMSDRVAFRAHRDAIRLADDCEIKQLATGFYKNILGVDLDEEKPEQKTRVRTESHPLYSERSAIESLFFGGYYGNAAKGGAGLKKKPSVKRVELSENQRRLNNLNEIISQNPLFYMGLRSCEDDPADVVQTARRVEKSEGRGARRFSSHNQHVQQGTLPRHEPPKLSFVPGTVFISVR